MKAANVSTEKTQPAVIKPMLATLIKEPFNDDQYVYEVKWDGYRIIAFVNNGVVKLQSRGGEDYTRKYPQIAKALKQLDVDCIVDGEIVYLNAEGKPDFDALQKVNGRSAPVVYYAFDLLWKDRADLMSKPLIERKAALRDVFPDSDILKYSDHFDDGILLFDHVRKIGLEGIVAKRKDSSYIENDRSRKWLKVATEQREEFVIGGWVESEKRNTFRTLLFGSYENGKLKWKGHAGGGYKEKDMPVILDRLRQIETDQNPFDSEVEYSEGKPHWVKPELVANVKFSTFTKSGRIRTPAIFLGFREDKLPTQVTTVKAKAMPAPRPLPDRRVARRKQTSSDTESATPATGNSNWPEVESEQIRNRDEVTIEGCVVTLHNVDRPVWKGITKADLIQYYNSISNYILPHVKNRPLSLHLKPKGANAPGLYIKDMEGRQPPCAEIFTTVRKHKKPGKRDVIDYLVCNNAATLLYSINLGCVDVNPWTSTVGNPLRPDFVIIDLDPSDGDFKKAIQTARAAKEFFDENKITACLKTSGKSGMHLFLPCSAFTFPQARKIAENICGQVHERVPAITTTAVTVADRGTNLYLDPNQNDYADTVAAVYSARPYKHPLVSTPLEWKEVNASLNPEDFTIHTIGDRLAKKGDLFAPALGRKYARTNDKRLKHFL